MRKYFLVSLILFLGIAGSALSLTHAQTADELQNKINSHSDIIKQLEAEINQYTQELKKTSAQAQNLQSAVKTLDLSSQKLEKDLDVTGQRIETTNLTINELALNINDKEAKIKRNKIVLADSLRKINETDSQTMVETLLLYPDIATFSREVESVNQFKVSVKTHLDDLLDLKKGLETDKLSTEDKKKRLMDLKIQLADQKVIVENTKGEKNKLLTQTKSKESEYKKLLDEKIAKKKAFEKELLDYESKLRLVIDPKSIPQGRSGVLAWPVADPLITQKFGHTEFSKTVSVYNGNGHNGIDLRAAIGTPVTSAEAGIVEGTGDTDTACPGASYGRWVLVKHNNGLSTLYAHFSVIKAVKGQQVARGELLGYSGMTGYATGPHVHFTVYASQGVEIISRPSKSCNGAIYVLPVADLRAYLDPEQYL
jgi:murein DD-endopeptidase MepM/ murein hydrolase activator NlpD